MKHCIPLQRIEQVEIECTSYNIETDYFNFEIKFIGVTDTKIRLTGDTVELINKNVKKIISKIKGE